MADQSWREIVKRSVALGFAGVYTHVHQGERASALRVAYLAYRFLNGEDVSVINAEADHDNEVRGTKHHHAPKVTTRVPKWFRIYERK